VSSLFVDSGAFYALADEDDAWHQAAEACYKNAYKEHRFLTSSYVFVESWTLIHHRLGRTAVHRFWETIREDVVVVEEVTQADLDKAWHIFNRYSDYDLSLVDCTSFAMMECLEIARVFTFDRHFAFYRTVRNKSFACLPGPTF
jgi:predicted nucleic acid-binding protein